MHNLLSIATALSFVISSCSATPVLTERDVKPFVVCKYNTKICLAYSQSGDTFVGLAVPCPVLEPSPCPDIKCKGNLGAKRGLTARQKSDVCKYKNGCCTGNVNFDGMNVSGFGSCPPDVETQPCPKDIGQ